MIYRFPQKDPDEILDYFIDAKDEFIEAYDDSVASIAVAVLTSTVPPLVVTQTGATETMGYFWLAGGLANTDYDINITIDTVAGRRFNGTYKISVINK